MKKIEIKLKNNINVMGDLFEYQDYKKIIDVFFKVKSASIILNSLGGRKINMPEVVSEGIYCYNFNAVRTNNTAKSYDAVDINTGEGIQIKSSSIKSDLTSFGPKSTWDKLIFLDFAKNGLIDGNIDVYEIKYDVKNIIVNKSKNETFLDQQKMGRRPRLSIKQEFINKYNIKPIKTIVLK